MVEEVPEVVGNGKAVFLGDMTDEEVEAYDRNINKGWGKILEKIGIKYD